ncbi:MAG: glycyl-radical enzyme activating protein [Enterobacteriaceae bacterium]
MICNIQRYSLHDGPGIRTVIFFKGCSLACRWCQNPESRSTKPQLLFDPRLCLAECQLCVRHCPDSLRRQGETLHIDREQLSGQQCETLAKLCPSGALSLSGTAANVEQIMDIVQRDLPFYQRSTGGITLSGGEPFMQPELSVELLQRSQALGIHTAVESSLHAPWRHIAPALPHINLLLADIKHVDPQRFKAWTGGSCKRILSHFRRLATMATEMIVRVPVIPEFNADRPSLKAIIDFTADESHASEIHFLPYHTLGIHKYSLLGLPYHAAPAPLNDPELLTWAQEYALQRGLTAILRG